MMENGLVIFRMVEVNKLGLNLENYLHMRDSLWEVKKMEKENMFVTKIGSMKEIFQIIK